MIQMVELTTIKIDKNYINSTPSVDRIVEIGRKFFDEFYVIKDLKVKSPENFGKGYGKKAFLDFIKSTNLPVLLTPSFSDLEDGLAYSGREAMSMDNLRSAPCNLLSKFYIPVLKKKGIKHFLNTGNILIIEGF